MSRPLIGITTDIEEGRFALKQEYAAAIAASGGIPILMPPLADGSPQSYARMMDGFLIPGGDDLLPSYYGEETLPDAESKFVHRQRSGFEISLIHEIITLRKPLFGICYGMQLINVAMGGTLYQDIRLQLPAALDHKRNHEIRIKEGGVLVPGIYEVNSTHHQAVKTAGPGLETLAASQDGIIEAFYMKDYPYLLGVQWHPERGLEPRQIRGLEPRQKIRGLETRQEDTVISPSEMIFNSFIEACRAG